MSDIITSVSDQIWQQGQGLDAKRISGSQLIARLVDAGGDPMIGAEQVYAKMLSTKNLNGIVYVGDLTFYRVN